MRGKPTPIFNAAAVGTEIGRDGICVGSFGLVAFLGDRYTFSIAGNDLFGHSA